MFLSINGLLTEAAISKMLIIGFEHLEEISPMNNPDEEIIVSSRLSASEDLIVWRYYLLKDNIGLIVKDGIKYNIDLKAKQFATVCNSEHFIQINTFNKSFNQLAAFKFIIENT